MVHQYEKVSIGHFITVTSLHSNEQIAAFTKNDHGRFAYECFKSALGPITDAYLLDKDTNQVVVGTLDQLVP